MTSGNFGLMVKLWIYVYRNRWVDWGGGMWGMGTVGFEMCVEDRGVDGI